MTPIEQVLSGERQWCVIHADNGDVLPTIPDKGVAHVITDPPYEAQAHTKQAPKISSGRVLRSADPSTLARSLSFPAITDSQRVWCGAQFSRLASRWMLVFAQIEAVVLWNKSMTLSGDAIPRRIGVWIKPDGMPQFSGDRPGMGYESIVICHRKGRSRWNGGGRVGVFTHNKNTPGGAHFHETQKPLPLMLELIELFTDPGDIVLDPFCGSGTTGVACIRLGRRFIGVEKDAKYAAVAQERLEAEAQGLNLRDARAGQLPMFGGAK